MPNHQDVSKIIGLRSGRLTIIGAAPSRFSGKTLLQYVEVRCDCGGHNIVRSDYIKNKRVRSCGCLIIEAIKRIKTKHGDAKKGKNAPEYNVWCTMIQRCENPNSQKYPSYGGRGIKVCRRWRKDYRNFIADMGRRPERHSIDRINVNGNYTPSNCRWATAKLQRENQRKTT